MNLRRHIVIILTITIHSLHSLNRQKRMLPLVFHEFGVSQFVCGFGVPVDLDLETVTTGIVFKSQLPLPATAEDLRNRTTHNVNGRNIDPIGKDIVNNNIRWSFYKAMESWATEAGLNGRTCVLKTLCEVSKIPFNNEIGDLWHEIAHILFTPFSSEDNINYTEHNDYLAAAKLGLSRDSYCNETIFQDCHKSLLSIFTKIF